MKRTKYYSIIPDSEFRIKLILGALEVQSDKKFLWALDDYYFQAFFYLCQRFGMPVKYDDYKDAGVWDFEVKHYKIRVSLDSNCVNFQIFGTFENVAHTSKRYFKNYYMRTPGIVSYWRSSRKKKDELIPFTPKATKKEKEIIDSHWGKFLKEKGYVDKQLILTEELQELNSDFYDYVQEYNDKIIGVDIIAIDEKYNNVYMNKYVKHAKRTLEQFLKNMLSPVWVRDVPYNLKGRMTDKDANFYSRYENNLTIKFLGKKI